MLTTFKGDWLVPTPRTASGSCVHTRILLWPYSRSWDNSQSQEKKACLAQQRAATLRKQCPVRVERSQAFRLNSHFWLLLPFLQLRAKGHSSLPSPPSKTIPPTQRTSPVPQMSSAPSPTPPVNRYSRCLVSTSFPGEPLAVLQSPARPSPPFGCSPSVLHAD